LKHWQVYIKGLKLKIPKTLKEELDILIDDMINSEMDMLLIIDGREGTGKSRLSRIIGAYISHITGLPFNHNNIHFNTYDYIKVCENSPKFNINILDESREALNKKRGMSKSNVFFTNWLSENRDKQQVHILILPAIHDLDSYVSIWRMVLLINTLKGHVKDDTTKSGYKLERGRFKIYSNNKQLQQVLFNKAKYGYYAYPKNYKHYCNIENQEPFSPEELKAYIEKKAKQRKDKYSEEKKVSKEFEVLHKLKLNLGLSDRELSQATDGLVSHMWFARNIKKENIETESNV